MQKPIIIYLIILIILSSCGNCEDSTEPALSVMFDNYEYYEHVYGIGGSDTMIMTYDLNLPLAINSDTTIYIFSDTLNTDTLGITYKRIIKYDSEICGFSIVLDSLEILDISSFDSAYFSIDEQTHTYFGESNKNKYEVFIYN